MSFNFNVRNDLHVVLNACSHSVKALLLVDQNTFYTIVCFHECQAYY